MSKDSGANNLEFVGQDGTLRSEPCDAESSRDAILRVVAEHFVKSANNDSFNGVVASTLWSPACASEGLAQLKQLVMLGKVDCVFARITLNPHIKRLPDLPTERQLELLSSEDLNSCCVYPRSGEIVRHTDIALWNDRPFSKLLALAEPQLSFRAFEPGVLERYVSDPRYSVHFADYMGTMSVTNVYFASPDFPGRDKVSLQTFGLGFSQDQMPYIVVFLRYLAGLSPGHQQYWNSFIAQVDVLMTQQYFDSSIRGEFWQNRSVRFAICEEMRLINEQTQAIWGKRLFREAAKDDVPIGLSAFLRPTADNYHRFVMALDKLLSENIDSNFFDGRISIETEVTRSDGRIEVRRKGSIALLEEFLRSEIVWGDLEAFRKVIIGPLREVRRLRQAPAHSFTANTFSTDFYISRHRLLWDVFNSLSNVRRTLARHRSAKAVAVPDWLDLQKIDVF